MKPCNKLFISALLIAFITAAAVGQAPATLSPQLGNEKVFVHLDRSVLVAGESIHYKVYISNSASRILYFMLVGRGNQPALQWRINLQPGSTAGSYQIPATMEAGYYELCAYTNQMTAGPFDYIFRQPLLIESLTRKIADTLYIPVSSIAHPIPAAGENQFEIRQVGTGLEVTVNPVKGFDPASGRLRLTALHDGKELYAMELSAAAGSQVVHIREDQLATGIIHVNLTLGAGITLGQRLYFYMPALAPSLTVKAGKSMYRPGETIELEISPAGLGAEENIDLSVSAKEQGPFKGVLKERTIAEQFFIFSELAGVELPVEGEDDEPWNFVRQKLEHTDIGDYAFYRYGRKAKTPCTAPVENKGFILTGHVSEGSLPVASQGIILSVADSSSTHLLFSRSDAEGRFTFYLDRFYDNRELILQAAGQAGSNPKKWVIEGKSMARPAGMLDKYMLDREATAWLQEKSEFRLIEAIYQPAEVTPPSGAAKVPLNKLSPPDYMIYPADYAELVNFKEIADNILPTVKYVMKNKAYVVQIYIPYSDAWFENEMILLNGVPFTDLSYLATLGTKDIARIEVNNRNFLLGDLTYQGMLSVYTHDGRIPPGYLKNHCYLWKNEVSATSKESTGVSAPERASSAAHAPDFRSVLYWNPEVKLQGNGKKTVKFTASQVTGEYKVVVCGISAGGYPLHSTTSFEVK